MNTLSKFIVSLSALIASVSLAWIAFTVDQLCKPSPFHQNGIHVSVDHSGTVELTSGMGGFSISHD
ncbi:MAG TPA: hypothetical protein VNX27_00970 [Chthoniobacterales bacterium]|jgi:hypothetical protein|nr:hypothetical protein [Chthoniobacterales bacterium]